MFGTDCGWIIKPPKDGVETMIFVDFTFLDIEPIFDPIQGDCLTVRLMTYAVGQPHFFYKQTRHVSSRVVTPRV